MDAALQGIITGLAPEHQGAGGASMTDKVLAALLAGLKQQVATPGALMQPNPYPPGSEEASWYDQQKAETAAQWGPEMALNTIGTGAGFAKPGAVGIAGGKLGATQPKQLDPTEEALKAIMEALGEPTHNMSQVVPKAPPKVWANNVSPMTKKNSLDYEQMSDGSFEVFNPYTAEVLAEVGSKEAAEQFIKNHKLSDVPGTPEFNAKYGYKEPATLSPPDDGLGLNRDLFPEGGWEADLQAILAKDDAEFKTTAKANVAAIDDAKLDKWLEKNPGGSISDFLGFKPEPIKKPIKTTPVDAGAWESYNRPGLEVPPRPDAALRPNPAQDILERGGFAPGKQTDWLEGLAAVDAQEALRQVDRILGGYTQPAFHGTRGLSKNADGTLPLAGDEFYTSANPVLGEQYASGLMKNPDTGYNAIEGAQIAPLWLNTDAYHVYDAGGAHWIQANRTAIAQARAAGAPGVRVNNVWDEYGSTKNLPAPQDIFITLPEGFNTVRSTAAQFNPKKFNVNDLLAGLAGFGVVGGAGLGASNER